MSQYVTKIRTDQGDKQIDYNALANLPDLSRPNILINSDFRYPVNQRGETSYTNNANWTWCYGIDRWACNGSLNTCTLTVNNGSITVTNNGTSAAHFRQLFERVYDNDTYTATISVVALTGTVAAYIDAANKSDALVVGTNIITFEGSPEYFNLLLEAGASIELKYIKLERGNKSTLFVPRPFAEEVMLCQRYFTIMGGIRTSGVEQDYDANTFTYSIPRKILMRVSPTLSIHGTTTTNSTEGICVRTIGCAILPGFTFEYSLRNWEILVIARSSTALTSMCYETQLYINDAFKIYLDAEIY